MMEYSTMLEMLAAYFGGIWLLAALWRKFGKHEPPPKGGRALPKESFAEFHRRVRENQPEPTAYQVAKARRSA
jgi:hypothetical protein